MAAIIPIDSSFTTSLDGKWRFKMEQVNTLSGPPEKWETTRYPVGTPETFEPFYKLDYKENGAWDDIGVPGNWEMVGYSPATYYQPDNCSAFYRKEFEVPASWAGRLVKINFDGVQNGAEIWLNGEPIDVTEPSWGRANYHESGWTAWQADLTPRVKFGQKNILALRVAKNTASANLDSGDYYFLGGIYRTVTLFSVPRSHIEDITICTKLNTDGAAEVKLAAKVAGAADGKSTLSMQMEGFPPMQAHPDAQGNVEITQVVGHPKLWSAEFPNLYPTTFELKDSTGKVTEQVKRKIGIREVTIKDGVLLVNGTPVKLAGICRHDCYAPVGAAVGEDLWRKDLTMMKAANINLIRTSHYPYGTRFYEMCDEMGFYLLDELPYCWCPTDNLEDEPAFLQRARETIARDKNHACVIIWGIGNENKPGRNLQTVADHVKQIDPTRPRLVSCMPADKYNVEIDDNHYVPPANMRKDAQDKERRSKWPFLYTESPNTWDSRNGADYGCLDQWEAVMDRSWDVVDESDSIAGTVLWEWQDRAVADKNPTKLFNYDPESGANYLKVKGLVDGWRNPRPHLYHLKMIFSPIKADAEYEMGSFPGSIGIHITNSYSFTDLSLLKANWKLLKGGKVLKIGSASLKLAPRSSDTVMFALPADAMAASPDTLRIDFDHPDGWNVTSYAFKLPTNAAPAVSTASPALPEGLAFPKFNLVANKTIGDSAKWNVCYRFRGHLTNVKTEPAVSGDYFTQALHDIRSLDGDIVLEEGIASIKGAAHGDRGPKDAKDVPEVGVVVGHVHAEFVNGELKYNVEWTGNKTDIQELGWTFEMPKSFDRFSWDRKAKWSVYPETHIGRPTGTARPDSANVCLTKITRPDAFDFNSTKYHCYWATLTDGKGNGLRLDFAPNHSLQQVRGGFAEDGGYTLVANKQCSPPRDLSTNVVPDLYLELKAGDKVEEAFRVGSAK